MISGSSSIDGELFFKQSKIFSKVFNFIYGHSLHLQPSSSGTSIKILLGSFFFIWCIIPGSVNTKKVLDGSLLTKSSNLLVDPIKSERNSKFWLHSGWAMTFDPGFWYFNFRSASSLNDSWTMQLPGHNLRFLPEFFCTHLPRFWSGAKIILLSSGIFLTNSTALLLVHIRSLCAFTSAVQFM